MGVFQKIKKNKEIVKIKLSGGIDDLKSFNFKEVIPKNATQIEIKYVGREKLLIIDYLTQLDIQNFDD